jgi:hypothetical protein
MLAKHDIFEGRISKVMENEVLREIHEHEMK